MLGLVTLYLLLGLPQSQADSLQYDYVQAYIGLRKQARLPRTRSINQPLGYNYCRLSLLIQASLKKISVGATLPDGFKTPLMKTFFQPFLNSSSLRYIFFPGIFPQISPGSNHYICCEQPCNCFTCIPLPANFESDSKYFLLFWQKQLLLIMYSFVFRVTWHCSFHKKCISHFKKKVPAYLTKFWPMLAPTEYFLRLAPSGAPPPAIGLIPIIPILV